MTWWGILEAARRASHGGKSTVTAKSLAEEARIEATVGDDGFLISPATRIASAWLSKFARWGYVVRVEGDRPGRTKKFNLYELTAYGLERRPPKASSTSKGRRRKSKA